MWNKKSTLDNIYINEIIRVNYKCNWSCKFCNVLKTNNYWDEDVSSKEVFHKILLLTRKYSFDQRKNVILSLSWWEPTLNKDLFAFIKLAKKIWIWTVEIQTNWTTLFKKKDYIRDLISSWLDRIFLAQHSWNDKINKKLWSYYNINDFIDWVNYVKDNGLDKKICINLNIVVTKINLPYISDFIKFLIKIWFINLIDWGQSDFRNRTHKISFWFCQPNWYANLNKDEVLLDFWESETILIDEMVGICKKEYILPDFHFTSPPICILDYKDYNLEYSRLKKLEDNIFTWDVNEWNLESYKWLWKEKQKFDECKKCENNKYCLWFYKNWVNFVWEDYVKNRINNYINK